MSVGYVFSALLGQLPLLAVLVTGFILLAARRSRLGARSVLFARLGLGALAVGIVIQIAWTMLLPTLYRSVDNSVVRYSVLFSVIGLFTALLSAAGIGLLIAAVVTRDSGPGSGVQSSAGPGQAYGGEPYVGRPHGAQPVGPDPGGPTTM